MSRTNSLPYLQRYLALFIFSLFKSQKCLPACKKGALAAMQTKFSMVLIVVRGMGEQDSLHISTWRCYKFVPLTRHLFPPHHPPIPLQTGSGQRSQTSSIPQKPQTNKSAYNSYSWGANWGPDPLLPVPSSERASQPGNYGNNIKEKGMWGVSAAPHPQRPTPCLSFMSVPFLYHPHPVVCIIGFVFSPFFSPLPFLLPSCIQDYETLLWALPFLCFLLFTLVVYGWGGEVGPPNIYQPNSPKSPPLLLGKQQQQTKKNGVMNMNSIVRWISWSVFFFFFLYCVLKFNGLMCLVYIKRKPLPSASAYSCSV